MKWIYLPTSIKFTSLTHMLFKLTLQYKYYLRKIYTQPPTNKLLHICMKNESNASFKRERKKSRRRRKERTINWIYIVLLLFFFFSSQISTTINGQGRWTRGDILNKLYTKYEECEVAQYIPMCTDSDTFTMSLKMPDLFTYAGPNLKIPFSQPPSFSRN